MSAIQRPSGGRPVSSARSRRPYSAYSRKGTEEEGPKYEAPQTDREWWRAYLKVRLWLLPVSVLAVVTDSCSCRRHRYQEPTTIEVSWMTCTDRRKPTASETLREPSQPATRGSSARGSSCCLEPTTHRAACWSSQEKRCLTAFCPLSEGKSLRSDMVMETRYLASYLLCISLSLHSLCF